VRTMYDACNPIRPPANASMVAGYISGGCVWPASGWQRWRTVTQVRIATNASVNAGQVLDVERGDAVPDDAPGWCARARLRGQIPTVYCSASVVPALLAAFNAHDVPHPLLWVAQWDGIASVAPAWVAKQYRNDNARGYDVSAVADYWPGVDPAPQPITEDSDVRLVQVPGQAEVWAFSEAGRVVAGLPSPAVEADLMNLGAGKITEITAEGLAFLRATFPTAAVVTTAPSTTTGATP
jgi:hypothetical protein